MTGRRKNSTLRRRAARVAKLYPYQKDWVDDESRYKICCKARQIGFTYAATLRVVLKRLAKPGLTVWLSASERQALEAVEQVRRHLRALGVSASFGETLIEGSQLKQHRVSFPNGSRIVALPANPDTVRGFSGDIVLDEFAFHRDSQAIWRAAFATATRGFQIEVISTPNGTQGKYYELARQAGLLEGQPQRLKPSDFSGLDVGAKAPTYRELARQAGLVEPSGWHRLGLSGAEGRPAGGQSGFTGETPVPPAGVWSALWCDIFTAHSLGFGVDLNSLRAAVDDEDTWQQEFCCQFLSDAAHYLPPELVVAAEFSPSLPVRQAGLPAEAGVPAQAGSAATPPAFTARELGTENRESAGSRFPFPVSRACYLGVDIGRWRDKTVLWLLEAEDGTPTPASRSFGSGGSGQVLRTRMVRSLERAPFAEQRAAIAALLELRASDGGTGVSPVVARCAIDATGIGAMLAEELESRFGARVEPVQFTLAVKEDLAVRLKRWLEERRLRIPYDPAIRRALGAVKRYTTATGHFRFDAARTDEGHADEFWALALACSAADSTPLSTEFISRGTRNAFSQAHIF